MLFNIITILVSAIACGGIAVAFRSRQELRLLKEAEVRHVQRKSELHKELALADAENEVLLKNNQRLDEHCSELDSVIITIASMYETLFKDYKSLQKECDFQNEIINNLQKNDDALYDEHRHKVLSLEEKNRDLQRKVLSLKDENQNLNFEIAELHQRVTRLSDLYKLVCEENKRLLEELNADMSVQVVNDPTETKKQKEQEQ